MDESAVKSLKRLATAGYLTAKESALLDVNPEQLTAAEHNRLMNRLNHPHSQHALPILRRMDAETANAKAVRSSRGLNSSNRPKRKDELL